MWTICLSPKVLKLLQLNTTLVYLFFVQPSPDSSTVNSLSSSLRALQIVKDVYAAAEGSHAIAVLTEWDMYKTLDYKRMFESMVKPAFIFDGRNILPHEALREIGFIVYALGKPLDPFLQKSY